jgi:hypothetical protein
VTCHRVRVPPITVADALRAIGSESIKPEAETEMMGGFEMIVCGEDLDWPVCACGITAEYLCDYPIGKGKTCDLNLCDRCKRSIGEDRDLCLVHHAQFMGSPKVNPWPPKRAK